MGNLVILKKSFGFVFPRLNTSTKFEFKMRRSRSVLDKCYLVRGCKITYEDCCVIAFRVVKFGHRLPRKE